MVGQLRHASNERLEDIRAVYNLVERQRFEGAFIGKPSGIGGVVRGVQRRHGADKYASEIGSDERHPNVWFADYRTGGAGGNARLRFSESRF